MLCYKGRRFCSRKSDCSRNLTDDVLADAALWWKGCEGEIPIDRADMRTDDCGYVPIQEK